MVDWDGLENRCALTGTVGSNPTLSAIHRRRRSAAAMNGIAGGAEDPTGFEAGAARSAAETGERSEPNPTLAIFVMAARSGSQEDKREMT